jgi:hypothetical protein
MRTENALCYLPIRFWRLRAGWIRRLRRRYHDSRHACAGWKTAWGTSVRLRGARHSRRRRNHRHPWKLNTRAGRHGVRGIVILRIAFRWCGKDRAWSRRGRHEVSRRWRKRRRRSCRWRSDRSSDRRGGGWRITDRHHENPVVLRDSGVLGPARRGHITGDGAENHFERLPLRDAVEL